MEAMTPEEVVREFERPSGINVSPTPEELELLEDMRHGYDPAPNDQVFAKLRDRAESLRRLQRADGGG
jgi:hypothetical protein